MTLIDSLAAAIMAMSTTQEPAALQLILGLSMDSVASIVRILVK
jgi:hypothetical protein